ncbi:MAG: arsenate reductase [Saprospiraceae bacterium]|jgi:arsenate reductase
MNKIYYLSTCSTCKRILSEIDTSNIELQDIKSNPLTENQLKELCALANSYESLFSKRAIKYKTLGLADLELTEEDYKKYLLTDYTFLKRPVAIIDHEIFIGNSKKNVEALKAKIN